MAYIPPVWNAVDAVFKSGGYSPPVWNAVNAVFKSGVNYVQAITGSIAAGFCHSAQKISLATDTWQRIHTAIGGEKFLHSFLFDIPGNDTWQRIHTAIGGEKFLHSFLISVAEQNIISSLNSLGEQVCHEIKLGLGEDTTHGLKTQIAGNDVLQALKYILAEQTFISQITGLGNAATRSFLIALSASEYYQQVIVNIIHRGNPSAATQGLLSKITTEQILTVRILNSICDQKTAIHNIFLSIMTGDPSSAFQFIISTLADERRSISARVNTLSAWAALIQAGINELAEGLSLIQTVISNLTLTDPAATVQSVLSAMTDELRVMSGRHNVISGSSAELQSVINILSSGDPASIVQSALLSMADARRTVISLINALSDSRSGFQAVTNILMQGDPAQITQVIKTAFPDNRAVQAIVLNTLSASSVKTQRALNTVSGDPVNIITGLLTEMADKYPEIILQAVLSQVGDDNEPAVQTAGIGDGTVSPVLSDLTEPEGIISTAIVTTVSGGTQQTAIISPDGICTGDGVGKLNPNGTWETNITWNIPPDIGADIIITTAVIPESVQIIPYSIYFDGQDIKHRIVSCNVRHSQDNPHNEITIESMDGWLFNNSDEKIHQKQARFEVHIPGPGESVRFMQFLFETKKESDEVNFTLWGRSLSALDDTGFNNDLTFSLAVPTSAKEVAESILGYNVLNWEIPDWVLPVEFEFTGPPMNGLAIIAQAAGGIIRGGDDNTITVCKRKNIRPVDMPSAIADIFYDRSSSTGISSDTVIGTGYNQVDVFGYSSDIELPEIELAGKPLMGQSVLLRVYWAGRKPAGEELSIFELSDEPDLNGVLIAEPSEPIETFVTAGKIADIGEYTAKRGFTGGFDDEGVFASPVQYTRYVFQEGLVTVEKPITELISVKLIGNADCIWYNDLAKDVEWIKYGKTIRMRNGLWGIAEILYRTTYQMYRISKNWVDILQAVFMIDRGDIFVTVKMNDGGNIAPAVTDKLLTNTSIAAYRGTNLLDNSRYDTKKRMLTVPYRPECLAGNIAFVNNSEITCTGNHYINSVETAFDGPQVIQNIEVIQCQV